MGVYFEDHKSCLLHAGENSETVIRAIADHYMGENPQFPFVLRPFLKNTFPCDGEYRTVFDLATHFAEAPLGAYSYAWAMLWSEEGGKAAFSAAAFGPMKLYRNGELAWQASIEQEKYSDEIQNFSLPLVKGWNHFVLRFEKTTGGFGGKFGTGFSKNFPFCFFCPSRERAGQIGWLCTPPCQQELAELPGGCMAESETGTVWLPPRTAPDAPGPSAKILEPLYPAAPGQWAVCQSTLLAAETSVLAVYATARPDLFVGGVKQEMRGGNGRWQLTLPAGNHSIVIKLRCGESGWGYGGAVILSGNATFGLPVSIPGAKGDWLFCAPMAEDAAEQLAQNGQQPFADTMARLTGGAQWCLSDPPAAVRPYLEARLYGKWNYPLGVTLFGLLEAGRLLGEPRYQAYVHDHIEECTKWYPFSLRDRERYGAAGINNQLSAIDSLDDCGSFAGTMLAANTESRVENCGPVAEDVAEYIARHQARLPDGTLYRETSPIPLMKDTMWIDDLYMSVPFLCRYAAYSKNDAYLEDAVHQFLRYRHYLYMPAKKLMAHVYDVARGCNTGVAWGRGNGWVLFSLSELLGCLPPSHAAYQELAAFFQELCEGIAARQTGDGFWHQVLTAPESYAEASCTAMFVCTFARGIRMGLLPVATYAEAAHRGWHALASSAVDDKGNVYGVCRGSGYSFSAGYYQYDLPWVLNDPHGIGIVMLAGVETCRLEKWEKNNHE